MWAVALRAGQEGVGGREGEHRAETLGEARGQGHSGVRPLSGQGHRAGPPSPASSPLAGRWALAGTGLVLAHGAGSRESVLKQGPVGDSPPFFRVARSECGWGGSPTGSSRRDELQADEDTWWPVLPHLGGGEARAVPGALWAVCKAAGRAQHPAVPSAQLPRGPEKLPVKLRVGPSSVPGWWGSLSQPDEYSPAEPPARQPAPLSSDQHRAAWCQTQAWRSPAPGRITVTTIAANPLRDQKPCGLLVTRASFRGLRGCSCGRCGWRGCAHGQGLPTPVTGPMGQTWAGSPAVGTSPPDRWTRGSRARLGQDGGGCPAEKPPPGPGRQAGEQLPRLQERTSSGREPTPPPSSAVLALPAFSQTRGLRAPPLAPPALVWWVSRLARSEPHPRFPLPPPVPLPSWKPWNIPDSSSTSHTQPPRTSEPLLSFGPSAPCWDPVPAPGPQGSALGTRLTPGTVPGSSTSSP